jgi:hypothetical protein
VVERVESDSEEGGGMENRLPTRKSSIGDGNGEG